MSKEVHNNHRERMRKRFNYEGVDNFQPHEVLELLLYYSISRRNTNPLGHQLLNCLGSFADVMDADIEELANVPEIGNHSARLIKVVGKVATYYAMQKQKGENRLSSIEEIAEYCIAQYRNINKQSYAILLFNNSMKLLGGEILPVSPFSCEEKSYEVVGECIFRYNANNFVIVCNRDNANKPPDLAEINMVLALEQFFQPFSRYMLEYIIISETHYFPVLDYWRKKRNKRK